MRYLRAVIEGTEGEAGSAIRFTASTPGVKRDGKDLQVEDWFLENYRKNPVVLWAHDYRGENLPIGRAAVAVEPGRLVADVLFDQGDEFARTVERKYRSGFLHTVSVGWDEIEIEGKLRYDLLDVSGVPVPGDPDALMERQVAGLRLLCDRMAGMLGELDTEGRQDACGPRGAMAVCRTEMAEVGAEWDGRGEVALAVGTAQLRGMHAWVGGEGEEERFELLHHRASGEVVWRGVAAGMARLLQATTQIPEADRGGVYRHLEAHYEQFGKVAPEFRSVEYLSAMGPELRAGLFLEGEVDLWPELFEGEPRRHGDTEGDANRGFAGADQDEPDAALVALHRVFFPEGYDGE